MALRYQGHIFDSAQCSCCDAPQKKVLVDPTQTGKLRARLRGTMALRWRSMRLLARAIIVDHDILGLKAGGLMALPVSVVHNAGSKQQMFQRWFDNALDQAVLGSDGSVMRPFITAAYLSGVGYAQSTLKRMVMSSIGGHREEALFQLAVTELQGIMATVSQQATRMAAYGMLTKQKPMAIVRNIWSIIDKVGINRTNAMIELLVVRAHAEATLDIFEAAKVKFVGLIPEARADINAVRDHAIVDAPRKRGAGSRISRKKAPSKRTVQRIRRQELALAKRLGERVRVRTAGDDDVCPVCEAISEEGPYRIDVARSLIPAHPRCRCTFVPADDARYAADQMFLFDGEAFICDAPTIAPAMVDILERMNMMLDMNPYHVASGEHGGEFTSGTGAPEGFTRHEEKPGLPADITNEAEAVKWLEKHGLNAEQAEAAFNARLAAANPDFYHEVPGDAIASIKRHGIKSEYGVFASVGKPSGYVSAKQKTIVTFKLPKAEIAAGNVHPDMIYGTEHITPHQHYLMSHPKLTNGYVSYNADVPTKWISGTQLKNDGALADYNHMHLPQGPLGGQFASAVASAGHAGEGGRTELVKRIAKAKQSVTSATEEHQLTQGEIDYLKRLRKRMSA